MKLRTKLIVSFSCLIALLLLIGGTSQYFNNKIKNRVIDESRNAVNELEVSGQMEANMYQSFISTQYYLDEPFRETLDASQRESALTVDKIRINVRRSMQGLNENLQRVETLFQNSGPTAFPSQQARDTSMVILDELQSRIVFYNSLIDQALSYREGNFQEGKEFLTTTVEPFYRNNLLPLVEQFRSRIRMNLDQQVAQLNSRLNRYGNILLLATLAAFFIAIILAYFLYKSITTPIQTLADATQEIGRGNLEKRIDIKTNDEIGQLGSSFNRMAENLNKITFSKDYVDDIIESMGDALIVTNSRVHIKKINSATNRLLGYSSDELIGQPLSKILVDEDESTLTNTSRHSQTDSYESRFIQKSGDKIPVSLSKAFIRDNEGKVEGLVCVASDISERKKSEETIRKSLKEKEILLAEIHHRVKNNLAVISGLLQMQIWETENEAVEEVLQDSQMRVKSIALVHEKLYQSENLSSIAFDKYVKELVTEINQMYKKGQADITFETNIDPVIFNINQAIPCSLLLNELIVNAYKHAFRERQKGKVLIDLCKENDEIRLKVKDDGVGISEDGEVKKSLGMSLVNTLVKQLEGEIEVYNDGGATFDITFNLDES